MHIDPARGAPSFPEAPKFRPRLTYAVSVLGEPFSPEACENLHTIFQRAGLPVLNGLPCVRPRTPWLLEESINGQAFQYSLIGAGDQKAAISATVDPWLARYAGRWLDGGEVVNIVPIGQDKRTAHMKLLQRYGIAANEAATFGDCAGHDGNDCHVRGPNSFNVGPEPSADPMTITTATKQALGFVEAFDRLRADGVVIRALSTDLDRTITQEPGVIYRPAMDRLVAFAEEGGHSFVTTGRNVDAIKIIEAGLQTSPASPAALSRFALVVLNGAAVVSFADFAQRSLLHRDAAGL